MPVIVRNDGGVLLPPPLFGAPLTTFSAASKVLSSINLTSIFPALVRSVIVRYFLFGAGATLGAGAALALGAGDFLAAAFLGAAFFFAAGFAFVVFFLVAMVSPCDGGVSIAGCSVFGFDTAPTTPIELKSLAPISPRNGPALGCVV